MTHYSIELIGAIAGLLLASNVAVGAVVRWLGTRSTERRDTIAQLQQAYQLALERIARVEGRADEQSRLLAIAQQQLADERVSAAQQIAQLTAEQASLRARIADLEEERDAARAEAERLRGGRERDAAAPGPTTKNQRPVRTSKSYPRLPTDEELARQRVER